MSTRLRFISQSCSVFLALMIAHVVIVASYFESPEPEYYEEANVQLGLEFLEDTTNFGVVIVGSSMGAKLDAGRLPNTFNLSFVGRGAFDGLSIIEHGRSRPAVVLVELNTLFRSEDESFTSKVTSPYGRLLNRGSHEMPVNYAVRFAAWTKNQLLNQASAAAGRPQPSLESQTEIPQTVAVDETASGTETDSADSEPRTQQEEAMARVVRQNISDWQTLPEFFPLDDNLDRLAELSESFADENIEMILFELPCHPDINTSPRLEKIREGISNRPGLAQLKVIRAEDVTKYQSNDGLHLIRKSSQKFTELIASELNNQ